LIQDADSQAEWTTIIDSVAGDDEAFTVSAAGPTMHQSNYLSEGESPTDSSAGIVGDSNASNGQSLILDLDPSFAEYEITPQYDIPADRVGLFVRIRGDDVGDTTFEFNGEVVDSLGDGSTIQNLIWRDLASDPFQGSGYNGDALSAGETYTFRAETTSVPGGGVELDVVAVLDTAYSYTFDNDNGGNGGYLDGPELFPSAFTVSLNTAATRRNVTEANFVSSWNDTSNNQYVELANDGSTFTRFNNSDTGSVTFSAADSNIDSNISLGRFGSRTTATPQTGFLAQEIDSWQLFANPDAVLTDDIGTTITRGVVAPNTITGQAVREAGLKNGSILLTHHQLAEFTLQQDQRLASAETTIFAGDETQP
jgi:hypothetical protein